MKLPKPDEVLSELDIVMLENIKNKIPYKIVTKRTDYNIQAIKVKAIYMQQLAYLQGWKFDPGLFKVSYMNSESPVFDNEVKERRMYDVGNTKFGYETRDGKNYELSNTGLVRILFELSKKIFR